MAARSSCRSSAAEPLDDEDDDYERIEFADDDVEVLPPDDRGDDEEMAVLRELMRKRVAGMSDEEIQRIADDQGLGEDFDPARLDEIQGTRAGELYDSLVEGEGEPLMPTSGSFGWGRWAQASDAMALELYVNASTRAADIQCEVSAGFVVISECGEPRLSGKLNIPVVVDEVTWALEVDDDDASRRVLFVELPKKEVGDYGFAQQVGGGDAAVETAALFESLRVDGAECAAPGLVAGTFMVDEGFLG